MNETICNLCGQSAVTTVYDLEKYRLVKCKACDLHFLHPPLSTSELKNIYSKEYYFSPDSNLFGYSNYQKDVDLIIHTAIKRFVDLEKTLPANGLLLDVGCAYGYYLDVARLHGWHTVGIEINADSASYAAQKLGLDVRAGDLRDQRFPDNYFDVVTCWDLVEHLRDPQMFFKEVRRILKPGGALELTTPDIHSLPGRIMGKRWMGIKSREHLFFFNKKTLGAYLNKNGFSVLSYRYTGKYVSSELFLDRLKYYFGALAWPCCWTKVIMPKQFYINPFDIMHVSARKRQAGSP